MPNLDEKLAFEHGVRITLKLMEGCTNEARAAGVPGIADFIYGAVSRAEEVIPNLANFYAANGYDVMMRDACRACIVPEK